MLNPGFPDSVVHIDSRFRPPAAINAGTSAASPATRSDFSLPNPLGIGERPSRTSPPIAVGRWPSDGFQSIETSTRARGDLDAER